MNVNELDRFISALCGYRMSFERMQCDAASSAQDIDYLIAELEAIRRKEVENEESIEDKELLEPGVIGDDSNQLQSREGANG